MAKASTFHCQLITPEAAVLDTQAIFAAIPAHDGEMGILFNRAPLLCKLGVGEFRVEGDQGRQNFFLDGGFAQVSGNELTVLTQKAMAIKDIREDQVLSEMARLRAQPVGGEAQRLARRDRISMEATKLRIYRTQKAKTAT